MGKTLQDLTYVVAGAAIILIIWFPQYQTLFIFGFFNIFYAFFLFGLWYRRREGLGFPIANFLVYTTMWIGGVAAAIFGTTSIISPLLMLPLLLVLAIHVFSRKRTA